MRHADTDRNFDDQSEAPWTVFEETSTTCSTFRRTDIQWKLCALDISSHLTLISSHIISSHLSLSLSDLRLRLAAGMTRTFLPGVPVGMDDDVSSGVCSQGCRVCLRCVFFSSCNVDRTHGCRHS